MHYFGIPRRTQSMIAYKIKTIIRQRACPRLNYNVVLWQIDCQQTSIHSGGFRQNWAATSFVTKMLGIHGWVLFQDHRHSSEWGLGPVGSVDGPENPVRLGNCTSPNHNYCIYLIWWVICLPIDTKNITPHFLWQKYNSAYSIVYIWIFIALHIRILETHPTIG